MTAAFRPLRPDESTDTARRAGASFGVPVDDEAVETWRRRSGDGNVWGLEEDGVVIAHGRLLPEQHWFGGRLVDTLNVAGVAVAPEHRRRGAARRLMEAAVRRGTADGAGLSILFPATTRLYRSLGWELAGALARYRIDARAVNLTGPVMRPANHSTDWLAIRDCHRAAASHRNGPAVRSPARWAQLSDTAYHYVLDSEAAPGSIDAYALVDHRREPGDWQYTLRIVDWAAVTPRGLRAVLCLVANHGTIGKDAVFIDGIPDTWSALVAEQDVERVGGMYWMARGLDLRAAVAQRGFPSPVTVAVTLRVTDPLLDEDGAPWRLEVSDGRGNLSPAGGADVVLDVRAVGPLYTGFRTPDELATAGLLRGPAEALELLAACFAGPVPMLYDFF